MIWFTSDLHLGHASISGPQLSKWVDSYRIFPTVEKMDAALLGGINDVVAQDDTLYHLGDFCFSKDKHAIQAYRDRIICKNIVVLKGNHDRSKELKKVFPDFERVVEVEIGGTLFVLSHYAHRIWNKSHHGSIHLYGHSHSKLEGEAWGRSMDVGVDNAYKLLKEWRPFSLDEIVDIMSKREPKLVDHHGTTKKKDSDELRDN